MTGVRARQASPPRRRLHPAVVALLALLVLTIAPRVVAAQDAEPATLTGISISDGKPGETRLLLSFNALLPQFSLVSNDSDRPLLGFGGALRGNGASVPVGDHGLLKSVQINQRDTVLMILFIGSAPIHVAVTPIAGRALEISITAAP